MHAWLDWSDMRRTLSFKQMPVLRDSLISGIHRDSLAEVPRTVQLVEKFAALGRIDTLLDRTRATLSSHHAEARARYSPRSFTVIFRIVLFFSTV